MHPVWQRRQFLAQALGWGGATAICSGLGQNLFAAETELPDLQTPASNQAVDRGLKYLATRQQADGSFGSGGYIRNTGVSALGGMAFLASGSTPGRGPYGKHIDRVIDYLLDQVEESGFIYYSGIPTHGPMYGHGFATLFLAECYGMTRRNDLRSKLSKAVQLIVATQNQEGGWRYQPQREDAADISVTICQIMALRAARNAGLYVPTDTVKRCVEYVKKCQTTDGGFIYQLQQGGASAFARSAAGVVALHSAGIYEGAEVERGYSYLLQHLPAGDELSRETHYFYGHYYAVQAMWQAGGKYWTKWFPAIRDALVKRQQENGSWSDAICTEYGTSMACIILQMPNNYLPIFQR
jgi:hypothetical protein